MAKQKTATQPTDLEFMQRQLDWPYWPRLPLKRYIEVAGSTQVEVGTLFGSLGDDVPPVVRLAPMFGAIDDQTPKLGYSSLHAVVSDGWVVD